MTEKRQFCPKGHDTFQVGRDSSYRCLRCKRDGASRARRAREAEAAAIRRAETVRQQEEARRRRKREHARKLRSGDPKLVLQALIEERPVGNCQWIEEEPPSVCDRKAGRNYVYCGIHDRVLARRQKAHLKAKAAYEAQVSAYKLPSPPKEPVEPDTGPTTPEPPRVIPLPGRPFGGTWYPVE